MTIKESDILFYAGGAALQQFGTATRRTMVPRRGGEEAIETHTRSGAVGMLRSRDGLLHTAEANTLRSWWDGTRYTLLLEPTRTNAWSRSQEADNAAWPKTNCTVSANAAGAADGTTTSDKIVEASDTSQEHYISRNLAGTPTDNTDQAISAFFTPAERVWVWIRTTDKAGATATSWFNLTTGTAGTTAGAHQLDAEGTFGAVSVTWRLTVVFDVGTGGTTPTVSFGTATADNVTAHNGDGTSGLAIWGMQNEADVSESSSYMGDTGASTLTRSADLFTVPFYQSPAAMQWYCRFIEMDNTLGGRLLHIGDSSDTDARFVINRSTSTAYQVTHDPATAVASSSTLTPAAGDLIELVATLNADGSVQMDGRKNGGATVSGSTTAASTLASTWSAPLLTINSRGASNIGLRKHHAIIGTRGAGQGFDDFTALLP